MAQSAGILQLNPNDNVAVALTDLKAGQPLEGTKVVPETDIPFGHKMAVLPIAGQGAVRKYGQVIGTATVGIAAGAHVHDHNMTMCALRATVADAGTFEVEQEPRTFMGYLRADGRVGTRNYVAVLSTVNCSATVVRRIAEVVQAQGLLKAFPNVDGLVPVVHPYGCGMSGKGTGYDVLLRTLWGTANNPNFAAVLLVGLGCEVMQLGNLRQAYNLVPGNRTQFLTIQESGGTRRAIEDGIARLKPLLEYANSAVRTEQPVEKLTLALQCGASDAWSGITANPALGNACDRIVALGGTVVLSETPEIYGAEHLLYARAREPAVADALKARIDWWTEYTRQNGMEMNNNPSPGNHAGGITTILEKSLGAIIKAGTSPLNAVYQYGEPITQHGLVFMDSPGFDPCAATGQVASGANLIAFTTGRGSAFGYKPVPSVKLASNSRMFAHMEEDMDINCGPIAVGEISVPEMGGKILDLLLDVASGTKSKSEGLGYGDNEFVPWHIGAVM